MTEVISVRFRGGCKNYYFDPRGLQVKMGDQVVVETAQGAEFATCTEGNHEVDDNAIVKPLCAVLRMATESDRRVVEYNRKRESEAFDICEKKIADHALEMKLVNVSIGFDGNKIIFYFTADGRVDFRELVRDLASVFRARIELRQIGVRDEAKMIGGLGICGRPFCCSEFLDTFMPVSIKMAKTQNLSLNPTKISGTCGRLMCCLKYEQFAYEDAARRMPKLESFVQTPDGPGNVKSIDLLRETVKVSLDNGTEGLKQYRNCEIRILRNGKGSRDGIDIGERTERYVEEREEEVLVPPVIATPFFVDEALEEAPVREKMGEVSEGGRARHRGPRHSRKGGKAVAEERSGVIAEKKAEKKPSQKSEKPAQKGDKPAQKADKAAKMARSEKSAEKNVEKNVEKGAENRTEKRGDNKRRDRRFGEKKGEKKEAPKGQEKTEKGGEKAPKGGEPKGEKKPQRPRPPKKPRAEGAGEKQEKKGAPEGEKSEKKPYRPHHRGGRNRGGKPGGQGGAPKAE